MGLCWKKGEFQSTRVWFETNNLLAHSWTCAAWGPRGVAKMCRRWSSRWFYLAVGLPFYFEIAINFKGDRSCKSWRGFGVQVLYMNVKKLAKNIKKSTEVDHADV